MRETERQATLERLRQQIKLLRRHAYEGHMPYMVDAIELIVDLLENEDPRTGR